MPIYDAIRPPTDNLYKFLALAGLAIIILSVAYFELSSWRLREQLVDVEAASDEAQGQLDALNKLDSQLQKISIDGSARSHAQLDSIAIAEARTDSAMMAAVRAMNDQLRRTDFLNEESWRATIIGIAGVLLGGFLAIRGFGLWYDRLQKYEDRKVKAEARAAEDRLRIR